MKRHIILLYNDGNYEIVKYKNKLKRKIAKDCNLLKTIFIPMRHSFNAYLPIRPTEYLNFNHVEFSVRCKCVNCYLQDPDEYTELKLNTNFEYNGKNLVDLVNSIYNIIEFDTICEFILKHNLADVEYDYDVYGLAISIIPYDIKLKLYDDNNELIKVMDFQVDGDMIFSAITDGTKTDYYSRDPITLKSIFNSILREFDWILYTGNSISTVFKLYTTHWEYITNYQELEDKNDILIKIFFDSASDNFAIYYFIDNYSEITHIISNKLHVQIYGGVGGLDMEDINYDDIYTKKISEYVKMQLINYINDGYFFPCVEVYFPLDNLRKILVAMTFLTTFFMFIKFYLSLLYGFAPSSDLAAFIVLYNANSGEKYLFTQYDLDNHENDELIELCTMGGGYACEEYC